MRFFYIGYIVFVLIRILWLPAVAAGLLLIVATAYPITTVSIAMFIGIFALMVVLAFIGWKALKNNEHPY